MSPPAPPPLTEPSSPASGTPDELPSGLRWRLTARHTARSRRRRYDLFIREMALGPSDTILDVGVTHTGWRSSNFLEADLPSAGSDHGGRARGDASLPALLPIRSVRRRRRACAPFRRRRVRDRVLECRDRARWRRRRSTSVCRRTRADMQAGLHRDPERRLSHRPAHPVAIRALVAAARQTPAPPVDGQWPLGERVRPPSPPGRRPSVAVPAPVTVRIIKQRTLGFTTPVLIAIAVPVDS